MKLFCDGVFDLFHEGHVRHFKKIKELYPDSYLFVGVFNDLESTDYKRKPYYNETKRLKIVSSCKYVDEATTEYPGVMTEEFIHKHNIDMIVHAFSNSNDIEKQQSYFAVPIRLNKMKVIDYNQGVSTSNIIENLTNNNAPELDLSESDIMAINLNYKEIIYKLSIKPNSKILEVGCGIGNYSKLFNINFDYFGIDNNRDNVNKNICTTNSNIVKCEYDDILFKDDFFDHCFCVGQDLSDATLNEMKRVTKHNNVFIIN
jgi:cytidyltransferase-like protein